MADTQLLPKTEVIYGWRIVKIDDDNGNPYYEMPIEDQMPGDDDFNSFDEAMTYRDTESEVNDTSHWIMVKTTTQQVLLDENELEGLPSVIITGSLGAGLSIVGPFLTTDDAAQHAGSDRDINAHYWEILALEDPAGQ
jgi:hypothetical protein